jgi:oxygen-independent coproporphyrinogen-3 oxidase
LDQIDELASLYFGGGTPSQLSISQLKQLLDLVRTRYTLSPKVEITLEVNPEDATRESLSSYLDLGINRLSFGVQSLHDPLLQKIGRSHTAEQTIKTLSLAHEIGFHNISIDLMYDIPYQTLESFSATIKQIKQLPIQHLSLYNLVIEPKTPFFAQKKLLAPHLPADDESLAMLSFATTHLPLYGLDRYEISAFAKKGRESVHNTGYWKGRPFVGLGPSAFSFMNGKRFQNYPNWKEYTRNIETGIDPIGFAEKLSSIASLRERLAIELRLTEGVDLSRMPDLPSETLTKLETLELDGLLRRKGSLVQLSEKGLNFYDTVAVELI